MELPVIYEESKVIASTERKRPIVDGVVAFSTSWKAEIRVYRTYEHPFLLVHKTVINSDEGTVYETWEVVPQTSFANSDAQRRAIVLADQWFADAVQYVKPSDTRTDEQVIAETPQF